MMTVTMATTISITTTIIAPIITPILFSMGIVGVIPVGEEPAVQYTCYTLTCTHYPDSLSDVPAAVVLTTPTS